MENPNEIWQTEINGGVYEASLEEITQWIAEGSLLPHDKIRRGNLRWIEAGKVPALARFFNAKERGESAPPMVSTAYGNPPQTNFPESFAPPSNHQPNAAPNNFQTDELPPIAEFCCLHEEIAAAFYCETCGNSFCRICPKSFGGNVRICPFCDAMCLDVAKTHREFQQKSERQDLSGEGFGFTDFIRALAHPLKYKPSLFLGAGVFMFFSFGQSAAAIGGIFMLSAALMCFMMANTITFGILANTINNFSQGKINSDFMPRFDDFSLLDDVVHPFFLSIGAYLSSFGIFFLVCIVSIYLVFSSLTEKHNRMQAEIEKIPGTDFYDTTRTANQSDEVKKLLEEVRAQNAERLKQQERIAQGNPPSVIQSNEEIAQLQKAVQRKRAEQIETAFGQSNESGEQQFREFFRGILGLSPLLVVVGFVAFLWGVFYFPAACAVAGYTRSFTAAINPAVGIETIKLLGADYFKILGMFLLISAVSIVTGAIFSFVFSPLTLPKIGNIPANIIGSFLTFYFSIVFSCILGYAIFKNADRLQIYRT